ncbi:DUF4880 domain-containing protein [Pigmentiphaga aceris]|uniref:DUF4880 domain-containing protein n=1 Tax=Pigmentiphaga aceris TaxID=1940612 RepID=A0A5C0B177_9BURK|nr:FecR domain-containing protein [Pigmentiphaga aceris]QEI07483.1 DUF4880 domain-containing protein [Pigmentiphaga aceris]
MNAPQPFTPAAPGLRQEVLDWYVRRQGESWRDEDERGFQVWLAADDTHARAYTQWEAKSRALDAIPADAVAALRLRLEQEKATQRTRIKTPIEAPSRRRFLMPAFATAAVLAVLATTGPLAWNHWMAQPVYTEAFATRQGQQIELRLPDGSQLRLDTATQLTVRYYRHRREVLLAEGQAMFTVQANAAQPFVVSAGPLDVAVVGTRFSVRHTPQQPGANGVRVAVEAGRVRVARRTDTADAALSDTPGSVLLVAGQQVSGDSQGALGAVSSVSSEGVAPWRDNRISFVDTPLSDALAELGRYGSTGLSIRDPAVGALRLSGTFDPRDAQTLRRVLPSALPVKLQTRGDTVEIVSAR